MREGETGSLAYFIQRGSLQVFIQRKGCRYQLAVLGPNQIVGEMALIDSLPRSASVVALEDSVIIPIDLTRLRNIMQAQPDLALTIVRVLVRKIREANALLTAGGRRTELAYWYRAASVTEMWGLLMSRLPKGDAGSQPLPEVISRAMGVPVGDAFQIATKLKEAGLVESSSRCFGMEVNSRKLSMFLRTFERLYRDEESEQEDAAHTDSVVAKAILSVVARMDAAPGNKRPASSSNTRAIPHKLLLGSMLQSNVFNDLTAQEREGRIRSGLLRLQRVGFVERDPPTSEEVKLHVNALRERAKEAVEKSPEFDQISAILMREQ